MLASGRLAALSPSLCLLDTHFLSCILHKAEARGPQPGRSPVSVSSLVSSPETTPIPLSCGSSENPRPHGVWSQLSEASISGPLRPPFT